MLSFHVFLLDETKLFFRDRLAKQSHDTISSHLFSRRDGLVTDSILFTLLGCIFYRGYTMYVPNLFQRQCSLLYCFWCQILRLPPLYTVLPCLWKIIEKSSFRSTHLFSLCPLEVRCIFCTVTNLPLMAPSRQFTAYWLSSLPSSGL